MAIPVVEDVDRAVRCLEAVGVGDRGAVVEEQARAPGLTVIFRDESAEAGPTGQLDVDRAVLHQQQVAGVKSAEEEAGLRVLDRRIRRSSPGAAAIGRGGFADAFAGAGQHPKRAIFTFHHHVLVEVGAREGHAAAARPSLTLVGGGVDVGHADGVEVAVVVAESRHVRKVSVPGVDLIASPERDRQEPVAVGEDRRFVERAAVGDAYRRRPGRVRVIGVIAARDPVACASVEHAEALIEEAPETALRVRPEVADERASVGFAR